MKILVTGSKGFIGKNTVKKLRNGRHDVTTFDIKDDPKQDVTNIKNIFNYLKDIDRVVHLAAIPHPKEAFSFEDYLNLNVLGTYNVLRASIDAGVSRIIYASSTSYYGLMQGVEEVKAPLGDENTPNLVKSVITNEEINPWQLYYGTSKVLSETLLAPFGKTKQIEVCILRFAPTPKNRSARESKYGTYLHVDKASEAIELAVEYKDELWYEVFNISMGNTDISKAKELLGFNPKF